MKIHSVVGGGGMKLHVREWGKADAPPVLFIHGWSQNHLCWRKQYESQLADAYHLVAFDLRGHGMSEAPEAKEHYTESQACLSSETKCNTPRRFDIGKVAQDLKECCHAIVCASVGRRKRPDRGSAGGGPIRWRHRASAWPGEIHHLAGIAAKYAAKAKGYLTIENPARWRGHLKSLLSTVTARSHKNVCIVLDLEVRLQISRLSL